MQVYDRMQEESLEPTATTYTALVSAYCKSDDLDAALEVAAASSAKFCLLQYAVATADSPALDQKLH